MQTVAGYVLNAELGRGAAGAVYAATSPEGRPVALKLLHASRRGTASAARFEREARVLASLSDPHLVRCLDVGEHGGAPYFVMERVEGESLQARLHREGTLPTSLAVRLAGQVARGLAALHRAGLVHRDVKPANVFLTPAGAAKLGDLGLVTGESLETLTATGSFVGTPLYMAPEQLRGQDPTPAADVYALGVLLFEVLSGAPPFDGLLPGELLAVKVMSPAPGLPPQLEVGHALRELIADCLALDPLTRPPTADAVLERLEDLSPAPARRPRRWRGALVGLALAVAGAGGAAVAWPRPAVADVKFDAWPEVQALDLLAAEARARAGVQARPDAAEPYVALAQVLALRNELRPALLLTQGALQRHPDHAGLLTLQLSLLVRLGAPQAPQALDALERRDDSPAAQANARLGRAVYPAERRAVLAEQLAESPSSVSLHLAGITLEARDDDARRIYDVAWRRFPQAHPLLAFARAVALLAGGRPAAARALLAELPPAQENPDVARLQAMILEAQDELWAAWQLRLAAQELDPSSRYAWLTVVDNALLRKDAADVRAQLEAAAPHFTADARWELDLRRPQLTWLEVGVVQALAELRALRERALARPGRPPWEVDEIWQRVANLETPMLWSQDLGPEALRAVEAWAAERPSAPRAWRAAAQLASALHRHEEAVDHAERALALDPSLGDLWLLLAGSRLGTRRGDAAQAVREARRLGVDGPLACKYMAAALGEQGEFRLALEEVQRGLAYPRGPETEELQRLQRLFRDEVR